MHEWSGSHALGALDPEDAARFRTHLAHCALCREEGAGFRETVARLAGALPVGRPPRPPVDG
ncbi:MAG: zf-HC2 domain-containing protein [Streptosporangiaceae bacterium]